LRHTPCYEALGQWLPAQGAKPIPVAPASPWEDGYIESFHSLFREAEVFESMADAREKGRWFRREYNRVRSHNSMGYRTRHEFSAACDSGMRVKNLKGT
jgi:transposase InsO family protein